MLSLQRVLPEASILTTILPKQKLSSTLTVSLPIFTQARTSFYTGPSFLGSQNSFKLIKRSLSSTRPEFDEDGTPKLIAQVIKYKDTVDRVNIIKGVLDQGLGEHLNDTDDTGRTALDYVIHDPFLSSLLRDYGAKQGPQLISENRQLAGLNVRIGPHRKNLYETFEHALSSAGK